MIGPLVLQLHLLVEVLLEVQRRYGTDFLLFMLKALEQPWLVRR